MRFPTGYHKIIAFGKSKVFKRYTKHSPLFMFELTTDPHTELLNIFPGNN